MSYTANKKIRDIILKGFKAIKPHAPKEVVAAATLTNLDALERLLRERQNEARRDIKREFDELLAIAYSAAITFGIFSFALNEDNADQIFPKSWMGKEHPNPNKIVASSFATISNNSLAVLKLIESGLEFPARAMMRITLEHYWLTLVLISDKDLMSIYHQGQEQEDAREIWHKHFKPKKLNESLKKLESRLFPEIADISNNRREHLYSFYTQNVHTNMVANMLGEVGTSLYDHNILKTALFGYPSASSVVVLSDLCTSLVFTYSLFFDIIKQIHGLTVPTSGEYFPFVHAMRYPLSELLDTVFKYDDYLQIDDIDSP